VFHAPTLFAKREEAPMRDFTRRVGWQSAMVTLFRRKAAVQWISLYRPDAEHLYSDQEQRLAKFLMPRLVEALTINRAIGLQTVYGNEAERCSCLAFCDRAGHLHYATPRFVSMIAVEWPGWDGGRLPAPLLKEIVSNRATHFVGQALEIDARDQEELPFLRARKRSAPDRLSHREET
jgi:hypothetical protein